ncbi:MAG: ABC transporter substrate-binding protein [Pseudomonadota bacterium]|jgi:ABC-type branched-subunit amino acid transport system substrate-binding protein
MPFLSAYGESLKLGLIIPLSGPASLMGESLNGVVKLANLKKVSPEFEDDRCEAKIALSAYHKLRGRGVKIFYMACSGSILAVAPHAKRNGDLILTSYAGSAKIRETGSEVLRFNPDAISIAEKLAQLLVDDLKPTVVMFEEQDYAQSLADRLQDLLGNSIIEKLSCRADAASFTSEVIRIKLRKSKSVVLIPTSDGTAQRILRAFSSAGVTAPIIGEVNLCDYAFRPSDFGLHGICVSARFSGEAFDSFMRDFHAQVGHPPAYPFYDAIALDLLRQLDNLSANYQDPNSVRAKLLEGFRGKFATYSLTKNGEVENGGDYLTVVRY